jgi:CNT family concentrative nucleoside transporter
MAAFALCGFANFGSIGIQLGGLTPLVPERRADITRLALRAMLGGACASWMTATVAGVFL